MPQEISALFDRKPRIPGEPSHAQRFRIDVVQLRQPNHFFRHPVRDRPGQTESCSHGTPYTRSDVFHARETIQKGNLVQSILTPLLFLRPPLIELFDLSP